jgi:hypothetical protein
LEIEIIDFAIRPKSDGKAHRSVRKAAFVNVISHQVDLHESEALQGAELRQISLQDRAAAPKSVRHLRGKLVVRRMPLSRTGYEPA